VLLHSASFIFILNPHPFITPPLPLYNRPDYPQRYNQHASCSSLSFSEQVTQSSTESDGFIVDRTCESVHYHHRDHCNNVPYVDSCHTHVDPMDHQLPEHTKQQVTQSSNRSGGIVVDPTCESVHYHHRDHCNNVPYVDSCHTRVDPINQQLPEHTKQASTAWCHVFKSSSTSSLWTQAASVAHLQHTSGLQSTHRRSRRAKRKHSKQKWLLRECCITREKSFMLSAKEIRE
jgi:hypothetical protein